MTSIIALLIQWATAAELRLLADQDTTILAEDGARANGAGPVMHAATNSQGHARRALLRFDLDPVPDGSVVLSAALELWMDQAGGTAEPTPLSLHRLTADWGEAGSNTSGGAGAPAEPGDATWTHRFYDTEPWSAPGSDYLGPPSATTVVADVGPYTWRDDAGPMRADVQAWVDGSANLGWVLRADDESVPSTAKRFRSREATADVPALTVTFLPSALELGPPVPGRAGVDNTFSATNAVPGQEVSLLFSPAGGAHPVPGCPGVEVGLASPKLAGTALADPSGAATWVVAVPARAAGRAVHLQVVQLGTCAVSAPIVAVF